MKNENKPKGFLSPEIVKLSERLAKDPASNLFVTLAEEYVKSGMLEEALMVLTDGLKMHPGFVRARVVLGRVYQDKGQFREAKEQFEAVIQASPDNLLAHRKLVKIYSDEGEIEKAIQSCRVVLNSNPKDEEMKKDLLNLESRQGNTGGAQKSRMIEVTAAAPADSDLLKNMTALSGGKAPASNPESNPASSKPDAAASHSFEGEAGHTIELKEESLEEIMSLMGQEGKIAARAPKPAEEELATESLAELYMQQGFYDKGIRIYQALLLKDPENQALRKKMNDASARSKGPSKIPAEPAETTNQEPAPVEMPGSAAGAAAGDEVRFEAADPEASAPPLKTLPARKSNSEKIQKLQAWLEQIKRSKQQ